MAIRMIDACGRACESFRRRTRPDDCWRGACRYRHVNDIRSTLATCHLSALSEFIVMKYIKF